MEKMDNPDEILNIVNSIIHHLNVVNLNNMVQKMLALPIKTIKLLEEITDLILIKTSQKTKYTSIFAQFSACLINDPKFNRPTDSKTTFQKLIAQKCYDACMFYKARQEDKLKTLFKYSENMTPNQFKNDLINFQFDYYNKSLTNCKFLGVLFKQQALSKKIIVSYITELLKEHDYLQIHCLCIILILTGPKLSKSFCLTDEVNHILLFKSKNSAKTKMYSVLEPLIIKIENMHLNGWINEDSFDQLIENSHQICRSLSTLPIELKNDFELKSLHIIAECIFDKCYDILFSFVDKMDNYDIAYLINGKNSWIYHSNISYVVSTILVALEEDQNIRITAGKLINNLCKMCLLSINSIKSGVKQVLNDTDTAINYPNLPHLVSDIINQFEF